MGGKHDAHAEVLWGYDLSRLTERDAGTPAGVALCEAVYGDRDWQDVLAESLGWSDDAPWPPSDPRTGDTFNYSGAERRRFAAEREASPEMRAYHDSQRRRSELLRAAGAELRVYGGYAVESFWVLAATESITRTEWDGQRVTALPALEVGSEWRGKLDALRAALGVPELDPGDGPRWMLVCDC